MNTDGLAELSTSVDQSHIDRFWSHVEKSEKGCWLWAASCQPSGYGQTWDGVTVLLAHRVAYQLSKGEIPAGYEIDHLCRVRRCVNPEHLEAVTKRENMRRSGWYEKLGSFRRDRPTCKYGHQWTEENTARDKQGYRVCRACAREKYHRHKAMASTRSAS